MFALRKAISSSLSSSREIPCSPTNFKSFFPKAWKNQVRTSPSDFVDDLLLSARLGFPAFFLLLQSPECEFVPFTPQDVPANLQDFRQFLIRIPSYRLS
jgi:hypothetical protein